MNRARLFAGLIRVAFFVALAAVPAQAQTTAVGPYYADPAWDQTLACTTLSNCPRFVVLSNMNSEAVLDRETGLVWQRTPRAGYVVHEVAVQLCAQERTGGRFGWRLPSMHELQSLLVRKLIPANTSGLFLPDGHPFVGITPDLFWTNTRRNTEGQTLFLISGVGETFAPFDIDGPPIGPGFTGDAGFVRMWCVRGGGPISLY